MSLPPAGTNQCQSLNINRWCTASCLQNLGFTMKALLLLFLLCVVRADDPCWGIKELLLELKSSMEGRLSTMEERLNTMEGHLKRSLGGQDSVHGSYSEWMEWGPCNVSCGAGTQSRLRQCNNPPPANGGRHCAGVDAEERSCQGKPCPESCPSGWTKFADKCYYRTTEYKTWQQSRDYCLSQAADLLVVNSREEQVFIRGLSPGWYTSWIGLTRTEGSWAWLDGSPLTTTYWASGRPDNDEDRNCAYYVHGTDPGTWSNNSPCSSAYPAICEK